MKIFAQVLKSLVLSLSLLGLAAVEAVRAGVVPDATTVTPPTVTITAPKTGAKWTNGIYYNVGGTVKAGTHAVANVFVSVNSGAWNAATLTGTTWTNQVTLTAGTNIIAAYATDTNNVNSKTNSVNLVYVVLTPLTLTLTGGTGTVTGASNNQALAENVDYTLTAKAATGFAFEYWSGDVTMTASTKLIFTMMPGLEIIANFKDVAAPTLVITAPKANEKYSNTTITVTGTAKDNVAVGDVYVQVNSNGWNLASGTTNWSVSLPVSAGNNSVQAYAVDNAGNISKTNTVKFLGILPPDWAPDAIAGTKALVGDGSGIVTVSFDASTFSQSDITTNGDSGVGSYTYLKTATNLANLTLTFEAPPSVTNNGTQNIELDFTNLNAGTFTNLDSSDTGTFSVESAATLLPATWSGHTLVATGNGSSHSTSVKFSGSNVTISSTGNSTRTGTFVATDFSPIGAMVVVTYTDQADAGNVSYLQLTFTSTTAGNFEVNTFDNGGNPLESDFGTFTF